MHIECLAEKPKENIPLTRPSHRWKDSVKLDLREIVFVGFGLTPSGSE